MIYRLNQNPDKSVVTGEIHRIADRFMPRYHWTVVWVEEVPLCVSVLDTREPDWRTPDYEKLAFYNLPMRDQGIYKAWLGWEPGQVVLGNGRRSRQYDDFVGGLQVADHGLLIEAGVHAMFRLGTWDDLGIQAPLEVPV